MTLLLCLNDVPDDAGGETIFPYAKPPVKVRARRGLAIVFHNIAEDGDVDKYAKHGALPVLNGTKW